MTGEQLMGPAAMVIENIDASSEPRENAAETMTNAEIDSAIENMEENIAADQTPEELPKPTYEEIIAQVELHFDGRIFTYKTHMGTAAQIVELCPMAKMSFARGPEFLISFLEKFDGTPEKPKPEEEPAAEPVAEQADEMNDQSDLDELVGDGPAYSPVETQSQTEPTIAKTMVAQVAISAVANVEQQSIKPPVQKVLPEASKTNTTQVAPVSEAKTAGEQQVELRPDAKQPISTESPLPLPVIVVENELLPESSVVHEVSVQQMETDKQVEETYVSTTVTAVPTRIGEINDTTARTIERAELIIEKPKREVAVPTIDTTEAPLTQMLIELREVEDEDGSAYATTEDTEQSTAEGEQYAADEVSESEDLETLYEVVADQLGIEQAQPAAATESIDPDKQPDTDPQMLLAEIVTETTDQSDEKQPVIKQLLVEVVRSIEILKWARSAEDCRDAVDGLRKNLALLLAELGHDNPEALATMLLEKCDIQSIDQLMSATLETVRHKKSHSPRLASVRHLLVGRHAVRLLIGSLSNGLMSHSISWDT